MGAMEKERQAAEGKTRVLWVGGSVTVLNSLIRVALVEKMAFEGVNLLGEELSQQRNQPEQSPKAGRRPALLRKSTSCGAGKQSSTEGREMVRDHRGLVRTWLLIWVGKVLGEFQAQGAMAWLRFWCHPSGYWEETWSRDRRKVWKPVRRISVDSGQILNPAEVRANRVSSLLGPWGFKDASQIWPKEQETLDCTVHP